MSSKRLDSISDYHRHGYDLRVTCRGCGRVSVIDSLALSMDCHRLGRSRDIGILERRMRCSSCDGRDVKLGPVTRHR